MVAGRPLSALKMPMKSCLLVRQQFVDGLLAVLEIPGEDHLADGIDAVALEEHVLGAGEADAAGAEGDGVCDLLGSVGVGANLEPRDLRAPVHELDEVL